MRMRAARHWGALVVGPVQHCSRVSNPRSALRRPSLAHPQRSSTQESSHSRAGARLLSPGRGMGRLTWCHRAHVIAVPIWQSIKWTRTPSLPTTSPQPCQRVGRALPLHFGAQSALMCPFAMGLVIVCMRAAGSSPNHTTQTPQLQSSAPQSYRQHPNPGDALVQTCPSSRQTPNQATLPGAQAQASRPKQPTAPSHTRLPPPLSP